MEKQFDMSRFSNTIKEFEDLKDKRKDFKINWVDDIEWYELCKHTTRELVGKKNKVKKVLKWYRQEAIDFQKYIIENEKMITWIIEWVELQLKWERQRIDDEKLMLKKKKILPNRYRVLKINKLYCEEDNEELEELLGFSPDEFIEYIDEKNIERDKRIEAERQRKLEDNRIRKEEKIKTEKRMQKDREEKNKQLEINRLQQAENKKNEEIKRIEEEKNNQKYQARLKENNYNEKTDIIKDKILYRQVSIYNLNN